MDSVLDTVSCGGTTPNNSLVRKWHGHILYSLSWTMQRDEQCCSDTAEGRKGPNPRAVCWLRRGELHGRRYWPVAIVVRVGVAYGIRTAPCTKKLLPRQAGWNRGKQATGMDEVESQRFGRHGRDVQAWWTPAKEQSLPVLPWITTFGPGLEPANTTCAKPS